MEANHAAAPETAGPGTASGLVEKNQGQANAGKARLLIVDDVRENREILRRRFERHGFHATEAD
jgi:hypothetical protein